MEVRESFRLIKKYIYIYINKAAFIWTKILKKNSNAVKYFFLQYFE